MRRGFLSVFEGLVGVVFLPSLLLVSATWVALGDAKRSPTAEVPCSFTREAMPIVARIRGLSFTREIPCSVRPQEEIARFIQRTINTKFPAEKLRKESLIFQAIGMIPLGYPYESKIVSLYAGQIGGYYDPDTAEFIMASRLSEDTRLPVIVHELTHGLQDQWFPLNPILDAVADNSDMLLARMALIEGDASSVTVRWSRESGDPRIERLLFPDERSAGDEFPLSVRKLMVFPYLHGTPFVEKLLTNGGYKQLDTAMKKLPRSTEEVLHPEKYEQADPDFVSIRRERLHQVLKDARGEYGNLTHVDVIGEAGISALGVMFPLSDSETKPLGVGWGGDLIGLFEGESGVFVAWVVSWDNEDGARRFERVLRDGLAVRCSDVSQAFCQLQVRRIGSTVSFLSSATQREVLPAPATSGDTASHP